MGRSIIKTTDSAVPAAINGVRFPKRVSALSESVPKSGSKNTVSTLSAAMIVPVTVSFK